MMQDYYYLLLFNNLPKVGKFTIGQGCPQQGKLPFPITCK